MALQEFLESLLTTVYAEEKQEAEEQPEEEQEEAPEEAPEEEEAEEEEEEPEDTKEPILEECKESKECAPLKHHLDECNERVANGSHENCIEEFFHLMHCADNLMAPKLFATLK